MYNYLKVHYAYKNPHSDRLVKQFLQKNRLYSMLTFGPLNAGVTVLGSIMVTALKYLDPT